jgi:putative SbcD/Mre11-related phosphoesterase
MIKNLQPIQHTSALWIENRNILVVADLHIGIENELIEQGVHIESQTPVMKQQLYGLCERYHPSQIMILGDVKHTIPSTPFLEKKELYEFIQGLQSYGEVHIIPGNHDGAIQHYLPPSVHLHSSQGILIENIGFFHGHRWPHPSLLTAEHLIFGHSHPTIMLSDRLGYQSYEPCWIKTGLITQSTKKKYPSFNKDITIVILPAFNTLCGGIAINKDGLVGPMKSIVDIKNARVFLLDGSDLGSVQHIK